MNPPFTKNQDVKHVAHALKFLADGGVLTSIMGSNTTRKQFTDLIAGREYEITDVPAGAFKESGTSIATIILRIDLPKRAALYVDEPQALRAAKVKVTQGRLF